MMIDAKYNQRLAKSWESRRNNPALVQDKSQPKPRHDYEENDMRQLNALATGIPASKVELIKEVFDKAGWQRKNRVHKDKGEMMALSGTKINITQHKGRVKSLGNHPGNKSHPIKVGNPVRIGFNPAGHPGLPDIPFMAEYYSYTQTRQQLDDEGFWDTQDGHFKTSEEQFRFSDLENELLKEEEIKYGLKNEPSVEEEAALAVEKGRRKSTKRVMISNMPPLSTTIPREDDGDTGIDSQSVDGSVDSRQDAEVTHVQETDNQVVAPTPSNAGLASRFYARLQELNETNDDDIEANHPDPDVVKRTRDRRRINTAVRRLLTDRLNSDPSKLRSKKTDKHSEVNGRPINAINIDTHQSKSGLGTAPLRPGPSGGRLKGKIVLAGTLSGLEIHGISNGQQRDRDAQDLVLKAQEGGNNSREIRQPLRPLKTGQISRMYPLSPTVKVKPIQSEQAWRSDGLKKDQAFLKRIQGDEAAKDTRSKRANPSVFWSNNLSQNFSEYRTPSDLRDVDDLDLRKLLEELYRDKKYMDKFLTTSGDDATEMEVCRSLEQGRDYLIKRALFWQERGPLPPRPPANEFSLREQRARRYLSLLANKSSTQNENPTGNKSFPQNGSSVHYPNSTQSKSSTVGESPERSREQQITAFTVPNGIDLGDI